MVIKSWGCYSCGIRAKFPFTVSHTIRENRWVRFRNVILHFVLDYYACECNCVAYYTDIHFCALDQLG